MLTNLLQEETRTYYDRLERSPLLHMLASEALSHRLYMATLGVQYGFYAPLENRLLALVDWWTLGFDLEARLKTPLLAADLAHYGLDGELLRALPSCPSLPRIVELPAALGCLYVLESCTLTGQVIARQLAGSLGLDADHGAAFFNSYGLHLGAQWRAFRSFLDHTGTGHEDAVIAAASATYAALESWYSTSYRAIVGTRLPTPRYVATLC
ncbi:MAG: biliverdin-producing heme oxygenase [Oscillochloridaceae bacterium umkhey_bin13]